MDPNANLAEIREHAAAIISALDSDDREVGFDFVLSAETLATLVQSLDEWITRGGFLPTAWEK